MKEIKDGKKLVLNREDWELTFEDDFHFFDRKKWKVNTCKTTDMPENNGIRRCAYYSDDEDNIFIKDNNLYLRTLWKNGKYGEGWYSAFIETSRNTGKEYEKNADYEGFSQKGGYFECRCKVAEAIGIWSAFWLMPDNDIAFGENDIQWSGEDGLEVDIMESPNSYQSTEEQRNKNVHVIHADGYDSRLKSISSDEIHVPDMYNDFHTYGFMWDDDKYTFYTDGHKTWETRHIYEGRDMGICKAEEYLILSTEVAGTIKEGKLYPGLVQSETTGEWEKHWCGNPDENSKDKFYDFIIDYVKCYKRR